MGSKLKQSEAAILDRSETALTNAKAQPEIASAMEESGYGPDEIAEGEAILKETQTVFTGNRTEDTEASDAYDEFDALKNNIEKQYKVHRKKAKIVFKNDPVTLQKLDIHKPEPDAYISWVDSLETFYGAITASEEIQAQLNRLKLTAEKVQQAAALIPQMKTARTKYLKEKGESEDATKAKDAAFAKLNSWMSDFYAVARIALEDNPQLLEALGITVK